MKNNKIGIAIAATLAAATILAGCGDVNVYDDDNGILTSNSCISTLMHKTTFNGVTTVSAKSFTGVETVLTFDADSGVTVSYDAEQISGRIKLVICDDKTVINIFECTAESNTASATDKYIPLDAGSYRIRLVGDDAEFDIKSFTYTVD